MYIYVDIKLSKPAQSQLANQFIFFFNGKYANKSIFHTGQFVWQFELRFVCKDKYMCVCV